MLTQRSKARLLHVWTHNTHTQRQLHCDQLSASDLSYPCIEIPPLWPLFPPRPTVDLLLHMHYGKAQRSQMTLWMLVRCFLATITGFGVPRLPRKTGGVRKIGLLGKSCHFPCFLSCRKTCQELGLSFTIRLSLTLSNRFGDMLHAESAGWSCICDCLEYFYR